MNMRGAGFGILVGLSACSGRAPTPPVAPSADRTAIDAVAPTSGVPAVTETAGGNAEVVRLNALAPEPVAQAALPTDRVVGVIDRAGLIVIVEAGLGRLFQRLRVSPSMERGRFVGFEITGLDEPWEASSLQQGDVIRTLNGQPIERPEQAMAAFEGLRHADELVVELLRAGAPATLRFRIE